MPTCGKMIEQRRSKPDVLNEPNLSVTHGTVCGTHNGRGRGEAVNPINVFVLHT